MRAKGNGKRTRSARSSNGNFGGLTGLVSQIEPLCSSFKRRAFEVRPRSSESITRVSEPFLFERIFIFLARIRRRGRGRRRDRLTICIFNRRQMPKEVMTTGTSWHRFYLLLKKKKTATHKGRRKRFSGLLSQALIDNLLSDAFAMLRNETGMNGGSEPLISFEDSKKVIGLRH